MNERAKKIIEDKQIIIHKSIHSNYLETCHKINIKYLLCVCLTHCHQIDKLLRACRPFSVNRFSSKLIQ